MSGIGSGRFHSLDALRGGALLLGVFLHAAMSFLPDVTWMVKDTRPSWELILGVFTVHIFRMSLFFTIAGFFAHMLLEKRGVRQFLRNRTIRIALPLVIFLPLLFACMAAVALWAAEYADSGPFAAQPQPAADQAAAAGEPPGIASFILFNVPLVHLWFLSVLLWLYAAALVLVGTTKLVDSRGRFAAAIDAAIRLLAGKHLLPFALAIPLTVVFMLHQPWTSTGGIQTPEGGLVPNLSAFVAYGTAFGFGWFLHRQPSLLETWQRSWPLYAVAAVLFTIYCARTMGAFVADPSVLPSNTAMRLFFSAAYPLAIWAWCFALFGLATRFLNAENKTVRYLSDSSYWIYLVHMPIVGMFQVLVAPWSIAWPWKYLLVLILAIPVLLASYQWPVRDTWIGGWLNGRRYPGLRYSRAIARQPISRRQNAPSQ